MNFDFSSQPVQAQHEKEKEKDLDRKMSQAVVMNMLQASFNMLAAIRGFFPGDCFEDASLSGILYRGLKKNSGNEQVCRYQSWIMKGIRDALSRRYLETCYLEVYEKKNAAPDVLLEVYRFDVKYSDEGTMFSISTQGNDTKGFLKQGVKDVLLKLIEMTSNLLPLPENRRISMRLQYNRNAPEDYQPPMFRAITEDEHLVVERQPKNLGTKSLETPYHKVDVSVFVDEDIAPNPSPQDNHGSDTAFATEKFRLGKNSAERDSDDSSEYDFDTSTEQDRTQKSVKSPPLPKRKAGPSSGEEKIVVKKARLTKDGADSDSDPEYQPEPKFKARARSYAQRGRRGRGRKRGGAVKNVTPKTVSKAGARKFKKSVKVRDTQSIPSEVQGSETMQAMVPLPTGHKGVAENNVIHP